VAVNDGSLLSYSPVESPKRLQDPVDAAATNKQRKLLWMGVGKDDTLVGQGAKALDVPAAEPNR
jgi:hypothetical protein